MRTFLGKSDFYYANVLFVQSSVPTMFLHFLQRTGYKRTGPAFASLFPQELKKQSFVATWHFEMYCERVFENRAARTNKAISNY